MSSEAAHVPPTFQPDYATLWHVYTYLTVHASPQAIVRGVGCVSLLRVVKNGEHFTVPMEDAGTAFWNNVAMGPGTTPSFLTVAELIKTLEPLVALRPNACITLDAGGGQHKMLARTPELLLQFPTLEDSWRDSQLCKLPAAAPTNPALDELRRFLTSYPAPLECFFVDGQAFDRETLFADPHRRQKAVRFVMERPGQNGSVLYICNMPKEQN